VVSVLTTGPRVRGLTGRGDGFLMAIKICSTLSFGWEVKPKATCRTFLRHVKDSLTLSQILITYAKFSLLRPFPPAVSAARFAREL
jgi:hypothetical protein